MSVTPRRQTITLEAKSGGYNNDGTPAYAAPVTLKARVVEKTHAVRNRDGIEVLATVTITLDKLAQVSAEDRVTYTDENGRTRTFTVLDYEVARWPSGKAIQTEVYAV